MNQITFMASGLLLGLTFFTSCTQSGDNKTTAGKEAAADTAEYFNLRPKLEKEYGYTHAVRIGTDQPVN